MSEENAFCNKCGFFGKADRLGFHTRPTDGHTCNYAARARATESPMTDQDHAKIVREDADYKAYEMAMALGRLLTATDGMISLRKEREEGLATLRDFATARRLYVELLSKEPTP